jgi:hypothetical protein
MARNRSSSQRKERVSDCEFALPQDLQDIKRCEEAGKLCDERAEGQLGPFVFVAGC